MGGNLIMKTEETVPAAVTFDLTLYASVSTSTKDPQSFASDTKTKQWTIPVPPNDALAFLRGWPQGQALFSS